jgi:hypothetical protein
VFALFMPNLSSSVAPIRELGPTLIAETVMAAHKVLVLRLVSAIPTNGVAHPDAPGKAGPPPLVVPRARGSPTHAPSARATPFAAIALTGPELDRCICVAIPAVGRVLRAATSMISVPRIIFEGNPLRIGGNDQPAQACISRTATRLKNFDRERVAVA